MPLAHILTAGLGLGRTYVEAKREQEEREAMQKILADVLAPKEVQPAVAPVPAVMPTPQQQTPEWWQAPTAAQAMPPGQLQMPPPQPGPSFMPEGGAIPYQQPSFMPRGGVIPPGMEMGPQYQSRQELMAPYLDPQRAAQLPPEMHPAYQAGVPGQEAVTRDPRADEMLRAVLTHPLASRVPRETLQETVNYITGLGKAMPAAKEAPTAQERLKERAATNILAGSMNAADWRALGRTPPTSEQDAFDRKREIAEQYGIDPTAVAKQHLGVRDTPRELSPRDKRWQALDERVQAQGIGSLNRHEREFYMGRQEAWSQVAEVAEALGIPLDEIPVDTAERVVGLLERKPNLRLTSFTTRAPDGTETTHVATFDPNPNAAHPITSVAGADGKPLQFQQAPLPTKPGADHTRSAGDISRDRAKTAFIATVRQGGTPLWADEGLFVQDLTEGTQWRNLDIHDPEVKAWIQAFTEHQGWPDIYTGEKALSTRYPNQLPDGTRYSITP